MKHVSQIALTPNSPEPEKPLASTRSARIWLQLVELFGNGFYREHGDKPSNLWLVAFGKLTDAQVATGLGNLGNDGLTFPPNLSQFVSACKRVNQVAAAPYWSAPKLEDKRERGHMPYAEWKERNGM